jgi:molybdopterin/thiamine biosynthesis adenylyltransferase/rhodanese-related sulfurtransferase
MKEKTGPQIEVTVDEAAGMACPLNPLIDIRSSLERQTGIPRGAVSMSAEALLESLQSKQANIGAGGYILCAEGVRSKTLVRKLANQGFSGFWSVAGGFRAWSAAGLPTGYPQGLDAGQAERYARHLVMPQVGPKGQRKLLDSRMLLVGLGGLNSPAALYLAAAGVGTLGLVDNDVVERSNLQRQVIHPESRVGAMKTKSAEESIGCLNPDIEIRSFNQRVDTGNADSLVKEWDVVVDGTDNFPARYALNTACVNHGVPLVYGAVMRFQGQVAVFCPGAPGRADDGPPPCFQCMLPEAPQPQDTPSCSAAGVLGVLPGIVGTLQASEALKLVLGIGQPLTGRLLMFDALTMDFRQAQVKRRPDCPACGFL